MTIKFKPLIISIAVPLLTGVISAFITYGQMAELQYLNKPAVTPSESVFPVIWTVLFILMGIASYLIAVSQTNHYSVNSALAVYAVQLAVTFFWPIFFFNFGWYFFSFLWLILLWLLILLTIIRFYRISRPAAYLMLPYILWVTFAGYINFMIFLMN